MTSKFNQAKNYMKFNTNGVKLDSMPDYSNAIIK